MKGSDFPAGSEVEGEATKDLKEGDGQYVANGRWHGGRVVGNTPLRPLGRGSPSAAVLLERLCTVSTLSIDLVGLRLVMQIGFSH